MENKSLEEQNCILQRKLAETESRIASRFIKISEETLPKELSRILIEKITEKSNLDILQVERDIASDAKYTASILQNIYVAGAKYQTAYNNYISIQNAIDVPVKELEKLHTEEIVMRERLFSLLNEARIKMEPMIDKSLDFTS